MELGLNFDEADFRVNESESIAKKAGVEPGYAPKQCELQWFNKGDLEDETNAQTLKFAADYAYLTRDYERATRLFKRVLSAIGATKSMSNRRDVLESLTRCAMHLGQPEEAADYAAALSQTSHPNNVDHLTVSHDLWSQALEAAERFEEALAHLIKVITFHPFVSDYWTRAGRCYSGLNPEAGPYPLFTEHAQSVRAFCYIRALTLLQNVESTVKSFVKTANAQAQKEVLETIKCLKLQPEQADRIQLFASLDIYHRQDQTKESSEASDFQDLGRSDRMKAMEKAFEDVPQSDHGLDHQATISAFEREWFAFLSE